jgi:hypothetical protein
MLALFLSFFQHNYYAIIRNKPQPQTELFLDFFFSTMLAIVSRATLRIGERLFVSRPTERLFVSLQNETLNLSLRVVTTHDDLCLWPLPQKWYYTVLDFCLQKNLVLDISAPAPCPSPVSRSQEATLATRRNMRTVSLPLRQIVVMPTLGAPLSARAPHALTLGSLSVGSLSLSLSYFYYSTLSRDCNFILDFFLGSPAHLLRFSGG